MHTTEYYSSVKRNEVLMHATTWINLENIVQLEKLVTKDTGIAQFHL